MQKFLFFTLSLLFFIQKNYAQNIDHWESIVLAEDNWKYRIGNSEPPVDWFSTSFNDTGWSTGQGGIGYGDGDDNTIISQTPSVYLRRTFEIINIDHLEIALLHADYDDGFIAYLNGVEIARANMDGDFPAYNSLTNGLHEAQLYQGGSPSSFSFDKNKINQCLQNGSNTLAIQVHNADANSSDLSANFYFSVGVNVSDINYSSTPSWFTTPFLSSNLPVLKINTFGQNIPDEPKLTAHLGIIDNGPGNENFIFSDNFNGYDGQIGIELRGSSSQSFPKNNYGFETQDDLGENNNVPLLGMPDENDWILHGPYSDKSLIRNVLAFYLGNKMGRWAPRTRLCELFINDQYFGVYILMEKIKRDENRVDIATLTSDDNDGDELTGGYIVQVDRFEFLNGWISPFSPNPFLVYHHPSGSDLTFTQESYIRDYVTDFEENLAGSNFDHPDFGYAQYIDVASFVDYFLAVELSREVDAYRLSAFLFKDKDSNGGKLNAGPLWDFNLGFGNGDYCEGWLTSGWTFESTDCGPAQPFWWTRLLEDENFQNSLACRWQELREGPFQTDSIMQFIDAQVSNLSQAQVRNFDRWGGLGVYLWPNAFVGNTYQEEIDYLKNWTTNRLTWMDENMYGICEVVAVDNLEENFSLSIQPNPFSNSIDFILGENNFDFESEIKIFDSLGKEIRSLDFYGKNKTQWDGRNAEGNEMPAGIYFYIFSKNEKITSGKILKF